MKIQFFPYSFILLLLAIVSCKKDKAVEVTEKYVIQGKILDDTINWRINGTTIQPVSVGAGRVLNITEDENLVKSSFHYSNDYSQSRIRNVIITSPAFSTKDSLHIKKALFSVGNKEFTDERKSLLEGFKIEISHAENQYFSSYGEQTNKTFEIIKVAFLPYEADVNKEIVARTSIKINCSLYDNNSNYVGEIKNLVVDADFRMEKE